ncbi:MAG TPA: universal stress protein [Solirubrobacteraceae bacterium]|nr:universal stress protein [Solirubrobacteraceae bacterium]
MTAIAIVLIAAGAVALGLLAGYWLPPHGRLVRRDSPRPVRRILLPFTGEAISRRSFEAAVRLAKAEDATVMPAFLATVPMNLPLETALPVQCARGMPLLESIEQKLAAQGVPVDSRIGRGRTARDALRKLLEAESFDRIIVSADEDPHSGLGYDDLRWLLERAPAEILILRTAPDDQRQISTGAGQVGDVRI